MACAIVQSHTLFVYSSTPTLTPRTLHSKISKPLHPSCTSQLTTSLSSSSKFNSNTNLDSHTSITDPSLCEALIHRLGREGRFDQMREVLGLMRHPTEGAFLNAIRSYAHSGRLDDAFGVLKQMEVTAFKPNTECYNILLNLLVDEKKLNMVEALFSQMTSAGIQPDVKTFTILIKGLCRANEIDSALSLLKKMSSHHALVPNQITYNTLIPEFIKRDRMEEALDIWKEMELNGCIPCTNTNNALLYWFCKQGRVEEAAKILEKMCGSGFCPDNVTFSVLVNGFCKAGELENAAKVLEKMVEGGFYPNVVTYTTVITALCRGGRSLEARKLLNEMVAKGCAPNMITYNSILHGMSKEGRVEEAIELYNELTSKGYEPNDYTHNIVFWVCRDCNIDAALKFIEQMLASGCVPDSQIFNLLMKRLSTEGTSEQVMQLLKDMDSEGCYPSSFNVTGNEIAKAHYLRKHVSLETILS